MIILYSMKARRNHNKNEEKIIIACETLRDELTNAMEAHQVAIPVWWMPVMHNHPDKMHDVLQRTVNHFKDVSEIRMAYGCCGTALVGIGSANARIVIPKVADCIELFLYEEADLEELRTSGYFLTRGWLDGEEGLEKQYEQIRDQYGDSRAEEWIHTLFHNYTKLNLIDTGAYDFAPQMKRIEKLAASLGLEPQKIPGSLTLLERLVIGDLDEHFITVPSGGQIALGDF